MSTQKAREALEGISPIYNGMCADRRLSQAEISRILKAISPYLIPDGCVAVKAQRTIEELEEFLESVRHTQSGYNLMTSVDAINLANLLYKGGWVAVQPST